MVVDGKADQTDVETLRLAMQQLDVKVAAKDRGAASAARDAEAISALEAAFKDMSSSMESSLRKLQQVWTGASRALRVHGRWRCCRLYHLYICTWGLLCTACVVVFVFY